MLLPRAVGGLRMHRTDSARRRELLHRGFVRFPGVLAPELLSRIQESARRHVAAVSAEHRAERRSQGCIIGITVDPLFAELACYKPALAALGSLGYQAPCFSNGYIISKPPRGPRLYWHQDWYAWEDARSYELDPPQVALMYYLTETTRENGCLRVIPGSHRQRNPLHDQIGDPHRIATVRETEDLDHPAFSDRPDEADVPATPGDLLVVDARMLHAAHTNQSDQERPMLTLWYQPDMASLPERMQAQMYDKRQDPPDDWPDDVKRRWMSVLVRYAGDAEPLERQPDRRPAPVWRA